LGDVESVEVELMENLVGPCPHPAGSDEKIDFMRQRYEAGLPLHHCEDNPAISNRRTDEAAQQRPKSFIEQLMEPFPPRRRRRRRRRPLALVRAERDKKRRKGIL